MDEAALVAALAEAESPLQASIETAIANWPGDADAWNGLDPLALWFLDLRFQSCSWFVMDFCIAGTHPETSFVEFPDGWQPADMARFLLTRWWQAHGRRHAAVALIVAAHEAALE